jgi:hypothetical protein
MPSLFRIQSSWTTLIEWAIAKRTTVSQEWIAERLGMKSRQNVSQQVRKFDQMATEKLPKALRA